MKKITLIVTITIFAIVLFGISSFAANNIASDAVEGVRNVVGGTENAIEGAATGITNGIRNGMDATENTMGNIGAAMQGSMTSGTNNGNYNTSRTATTRMATTTNSTFLGMSATAWGWFIMSVVGIITVALVWYYGKQHEESYSNNNDNY